jgi:error-prone DNA polymerase
MESIETRLRAGMTERGIEPSAQEQIVKSITSFALYGFPESHAASFALIAYASAYLKVHHPAAFYVGLLNAWPMGFYHPATLVKDAERHDTPVLPLDVNRSGWRCRWERAGDGRPGVRLGLRYVKGLRQAAGEAVERAAAERPYASTADVARRAGLRDDELAALAGVGAFGSLGLTRRGALWQAAAIGAARGPLFGSESDTSSYAGRPAERGAAFLGDDEPSPLPEMSTFEETVADYGGASLTAGPHLMAHFRPDLARQGILSLAEAERRPDGHTVRVAGAVIVRQRPGTAKGFVFLSLEDETGILQAIIRPDLFKEHRTLIVGSPGLVIEGRLQKRDGTLSVKAERFWKLPAVPEVPSHDFR